MKGKQQQELVHQDKNKATCPISYCHKQGIQEIVERLPDTGTYIRFKHDDGSEAHGWALYEDITDLGKNMRSRQDPQKILCPVCGNYGIISSWIPKTSEPWIIKYRIRHDRTAFCQIKKQEHRDIILHRLKRYILPEPQLRLQPAEHPKRPKKQQRQQGRIMNCPQCHHRGTLVIADSKKGTFLIRHHWNKGGRHYLKKGLETEIAQRRHKRR